MNCPNCSSRLSFISNRCDRCGEDLKMYKKILSASNGFYNEGLKKAKVRDLSGAILVLEKSLQLDKRNTNARNLLGLIYYEMGETVTALGEWVLSKHFQDKDNDADVYMDAIQENPTRLHTINQTIKKYNYALMQAKQGSGDLAIIQLKKVINLNPKYIRAYQLLALLYMQSGENDKAIRYLRKTQKIDINNTTTLRYLKELGATTETVKKEAVKREGEETKEPSKNVNARREEPTYFSPPGDYKEEKNGWHGFLNLVIGIIIGVAAVFFLVVPTIEKNITDKYNDSVRASNEEQASAEAKLSTVEGEKKALEQTKEDLEKQIKELKSDQFNDKVYNNFMKSVKLYMEGKKEEASEALINMDMSKIKLQAAKDIYNFIKEDAFGKISEDIYKEGNTSFNLRKYDEAIKSFNKALKYNSDNVEAIFMLGRTYEEKNEPTKAAKYYNKIIEKYADSSRVNDAANRLERLNLE